MSEPMYLSLVGAYSDRDANLQINGSPEALDALAHRLRVPGHHVVQFDAWRQLDRGYRPASELELSVQAHGLAKVRIIRKGERFVVSGGLEAMTCLSDSLLGLSEAVVQPGGVPRHLDLEPYEGGAVLEQTGFGMTIVLVEEPGVGPAL